MLNRSTTSTIQKAKTPSTVSAKIPANSSGVFKLPFATINW